MICSRPQVRTNELSNGISYAQCANCTQVSPWGEDADGPWSEAHHAEANAAQTRIESAVRSA